MAAIQIVEVNKMAITDSDVTYTLVTQGITGTPQNLKSNIMTSKTFQPRSNAPFMSDLTVDCITSSTPTSVIYKFADDDAFYEFCRNGTAYTFFTPTYPIGDVHHLDLIGNSNSGNTAFIVARGVNNEWLRDYQISIPQLIYERYCVGLAPDYVREPIYLTLVADMTQEQCYFGFLGDFSNQIQQDYPATKNEKCSAVNGGAINSIEILRMMLDESMLPDREGGAPTGEAGGGGGLYDYPYTAIPEPQLPTVSVCDTGMISLYNTNASQMYQLANKLWDRSFFDNIIKNFQSPMDNIISLHVVPFIVYGGTQSDIHIGNYDTEIPSNRLESSYFNVDCGIVELNGAYKTFADYAPFTDIQLYLPYIGIVPISPDDIIDGAINVKYNIDVFSGACVAYIMARLRGMWTCINQYQGNIITQYPITGADFTNVYVGLAMGTAKVLTGSAMLTSLPTMNASTQAGNDIGNAIGGASQITSGVSQMLTAKPTYQRSGGIGSSAGLMSVQTPYLIISKPNYIQANNFRSQKGYISNLTCTIGNESGFLSSKVTNEQLTDINCTITERDMIRSKLAEGVYI